MNTDVKDFANWVLAQIDGLPPMEKVDFGNMMSLYLQNGMMAAYREYDKSQKDIISALSKDNEKLRKSYLELVYEKNLWQEERAKLVNELNSCSTEMEMQQKISNQKKELQKIQKHYNDCKRLLDFLLDSVPNARELVKNIDLIENED